MALVPARRARRAIAVARLLLTVGVGGAASAAFGQTTPQNPSFVYPLSPWGVWPTPSGPSLLPPDTTLQPNAPPPILTFPTYNPYLRPISNEPLGPWRITPRIELQETFDSNPFGAPRGQERPDGFTSLLPGVNISRQGAHNTFVLDYAAEGRKYYNDTGLDTIRNFLSEYSISELSPELLFLDTRASIGQATINQRGAISALPTAQATNNTEYYDYSLSPYMRNHLGNFADTELRYLFEQNAFQNSGGGQIPNALTHQFTGTMNSGNDFNRLIWSINGAYSETDRSNLTSGAVLPQFANRNLNGAATRTVASLGGEYAVTREVSVLATGGYESLIDPLLVHNINGAIWSGGIRLRPGPRTNILLTYGYQQGAHQWGGHAIYSPSDATRFTASYNEGLVTTDALFSNSLATLGTDEFGNFIDSNTRRQFNLGSSLFSLTNVSFRQKRFESTFHAARQNNYYDAIFYHEDRIPQISLFSDSAYGGSVSYGRDLNPLTNAYVEGRYLHDTFMPDNRVDQVYGFTLGLRYSLSASTDTYANYSYLQRDSSQSGFNLQDNVVWVGIRKFF